MNYSSWSPGYSPSIDHISICKSRYRTCLGYIHNLLTPGHPGKGPQRMPPKIIVTTDTTTAFIISGKRPSEPEELPGTGKKWLDDSFCSAADSWRNAQSISSENASYKIIRHTLKATNPTITPSAKKMTAWIIQIKPHTKITDLWVFPIVISVR